MLYFFIKNPPDKGCYNILKLPALILMRVIVGLVVSYNPVSKSPM